MKINIPEGSVTMADLKSKVAGNFPNYKVKDFNKSIFIVAKTNAIAVNVIVKKNRINVVGNFPTMGGRLLFALSIVLLGFLLPLIIYLSVFLPKFSKLEKEVTGYIKQELNITT